MPFHSGLSLMLASHESAPPAASCPAAVLINPHSFNSEQKNLAEKVGSMAREAQAPVAQACNPETFRQSLGELLAHNPEVLVVVGGDGTVQAVVTELIRRGLGANAPLLYLFHGGRTNLTASDLNRRKNPIRALDSVLFHGPGAGTTRIRPVLEIQVDGQEPEYGFFLAGALVDQIIRQAHKDQGKTGSRRFRRIRNQWQVTRQMLGHLSGVNRLPALKARVDAGELGQFERPLRILLASSLKRLAPGVDPFADRGTGRFQFTAVASGAPRVWRRLPGLVRGRLPAEATAQAGYISGLSNRVTIQGISEFSLDGQKVDLSGEKRLTIQAGPDIRFLVS